MPSAKLTALVSLAGGQVPTDLAYIVDVSAGAAGSKSSTLNDLLSIITRNITDLTLGFQDGAAGTVSAANQGKIRYNDSVPAFQVSLNTGAYDTIATLTAAQTLANKTLTTPTIASFTNAQHNHQNAAGGGTIALAAINNFGANVATFLATPTSANLAAAVTDETGSGALVFGTSPTIVTPTIASFTNAQHDHTSAAGGGQITLSAISNFGAGVATFLATPTSANLAAAVTDETGTGALVFATSPTIVTPTIASFTNAQHNHENAAGGGTIALAAINNFGANVATFLATPTSANLAAAVTDETGTGLLVFATAPTLTGTVDINSPAAGTIALTVDSAAAPTANIVEFRQNGSATVQTFVDSSGFIGGAWNLRLTAQVNVASDATVNQVTDLTFSNIVSGRSYSFRARAFVTCGAGGLRFNFGGTATVSAIKYCAYLVKDDDGSVAAASVFTAQTDTQIAQTLTQAMMVFEGAFTASGAGTFGLQFAQQNSNAANSSLQTLSHIEILRLN